jgi:hypothetical protein
MLQYILLLLSITVGSYKKEIITTEIHDKIREIEPKVIEFLENNYVALSRELLSNNGYNGLYPDGNYEEVWSQLVNGHVYIVKKNYNMDNSLCFRFYESFKGDKEVLSAYPCNSIWEIAESD